MQYRHNRLSNGLTIAGEVNPSAQTAAVGFFVRTGSRDETSEISGVSHFLEHMMFKGTDDLTALEVNEAFDQTGAKFNAFTSEENTVYYAAVLPEYLAEVTELWTKLMRPSLRDDDFNIEKNVIIEEISMYKDLPHFDVMDRCRSLHFGDHPCGNSVLGTEESITALAGAQMREYFSRRYAPDNMVVACCGNFDFDNLCSLIDTRCGKWQPCNADRQLGYFGGSYLKERQNRANLVREHICMISPAVSAQDDRRFAMSILATIVGDETGSRYFWGLVDSAITETAVMQYESMDGVGAMYTYIRCSPDDSAKASDIVGQIFDDLAADGITPTELQAAKNKVLSAMTIRSEQPMGRLVSVGFNQVYLGGYRSVQDDVEAVKAVTRDDVNSLITGFDLRKFTRFSLAPQ
jgi:predicted Zn-dependent peptidase